MRRNKKKLWVVVYWCETEEISIESVEDIKESVKPRFIRENWEGHLPRTDADATTLYEAKFLKISGKY